VKAIGKSAEKEKIANPDLMEKIGDSVEWDVIWDIKPASFVSESKLKQASDAAYHILKISRDRLLGSEVRRRDPAKLVDLAPGVSREERDQLAKELKELEGKQDRKSRFQKSVIEDFFLFADNHRWEDYRRDLGWKFPFIQQRFLKEMREFRQALHQPQTEEGFAALNDRFNELMHGPMQLGLCANEQEVGYQIEHRIVKRGIEKYLSDLPPSVILELTESIQYSDKLKQLKSWGATLLLDPELAAQNQYLKKGVEEIFQGLLPSPQPSPQGEGEKMLPSPRGEGGRRPGEGKLQGVAKELTTLHDQLQTLIQKKASDEEIEKTLAEGSENISKKKLSKKEIELIHTVLQSLHELHQADKIFCESLRAGNYALQEMQEDLAFGYGQFGNVMQGAVSPIIGTERRIQRGILEIEQRIGARVKIRNWVELDQDFKKLHRDLNDYGSKYIPFDGSVLYEARKSAKQDYFVELVNLAQSSGEAAVLEMILGPGAALARLTAVLKQVRTAARIAGGAIGRGYTLGATGLLKAGIRQGGSAFKAMRAGAAAMVKGKAKNASTTGADLAPLDPWESFGRSFAGGVDLKFSVLHYTAASAMTFAEEIVKLLPAASAFSYAHLKKELPLYIEEKFPEMLAEGAKGFVLTPLDNALNVLWGKIHGKTVRNEKNDNLLDWGFSGFATAVSMFASAAIKNEEKAIEGELNHPLKPVSPSRRERILEGGIELGKSLPGRVAKKVRGGAEETFEESIDQRLGADGALGAEESSQLAAICGGVNIPEVGGAAWHGLKKIREILFHHSQRSDLSLVEEDLLGQIGRVYGELRPEGFDPVIFPFKTSSIKTSIEQGVCSLLL
jgi:hypothetical protein